MPFSISTNSASNMTTRINHSASFVLGNSNNCLDTCPKCGKNICEHTSIADVIYLPNSVSQDFSTYSSDSSLIKQLFSESTSSTATATSFYYPNFNFSDPNNLDNQQISLNAINQLISISKKNAKPSNFSSNIHIQTLRPLSCQVVLDSQKTDKLIKDFFLDGSVKKLESGPVSQTLDNDLKDEIKKSTKKRKFSNFRLFSRSHAKEENKPSPSRHLLRSSGFVNCLTSSSSSSSCEEISHGLRSHQKLRKTAQKSTIDVVIENPNLNQSVASLNSKLTHEVDDENGYNEIQTLELCPIVPSDIDEEEYDLVENEKNEMNVIPNNFDLCNYNDNSNNNENKNTKSFISVKLNNFFYYNYETKHETNKNQSSQSKSKSSTSSITDSSTEITEIHRPVLDYSSSTTATLTRPLIALQSSSVSQPSINNNNLNKPHINIINNKLDLDNSVKLNRKQSPKHRSSYFSSCSTYDTSTSSPSNKISSIYSSSTEEPIVSPKYHTIAVIFILIGLFSVNFLQETLLLFYYYNTEQFYWFIYSLIAVFSGQVITLILSLLAEIDLVNLSAPKLTTNRCSTTRSTTSSTASSPREPLFNETSSNDASEILNSSNDTEMYNVFKNPFSKLCLLLPGYLPISVYIQFFKHVFNYKKSTSRAKFRSEFKLSLHLFFNSVFNSLPLVIINSCYLASTTKSNSQSWYYTELFSLFTASSSSFFNYFYSSNNNTSINESKTTQSQTSMTYLLNPNLSLGIHERKSHSILLLVSIFISISIGICLFITYYELMKQMSFLTQIVRRNLIGNKNEALDLDNKNARNRKSPFDLIDQKLMNLGLVEILVYFCYRFCLITSRLSIIALFWYLFNEWLFLFILSHILIGYLSTFLTVDQRISASNEKEKEIGIHTKSSKLNQYLTLFIICLLSFIDLFMNQLSELNHMRKVLFYYILYFIQNISVLSYWLVKTILSSRSEQERTFDNFGNQRHVTATFHDNSGMSVLVRPALTQTSSSQPYLQNSPTMTACYATLIYLCCILFTIFGLILKFLHLHIIRKRYRRLCDLAKF